MRVGIGFDVHRLVPSRKLILGGVEIPADFGLDGHSDADVLVHAICDALLGACALGDIGQHFPNTDSAYRGVSSLLFLTKVRDMLEVEGYEVVNVDSTLIAEKPRLAKFRTEMQRNIAKVLQIEPERVGIKAGTHEQLGALGRAEGIACHAVALIKRRDRDGS